MKLAQNQVWKHTSGYFRIVHLERLEVRYKLTADLTTLDGRHFAVTKKEFCRLIKEATLMSDEEIRTAKNHLPATGEAS